MNSSVEARSVGEDGSGKIMSLSEAVGRFVKPGDAVAMGLGLEAAIPFAVGYEMIRQNKKDLTLIGPISDMLFDVLIGGGIVKRIKAAWVGNVTTGLGYNFKRAVESGSVEMVDYSNFTMSIALKAAADGLPFGLSLSLPGSDIMARHPDMTQLECPFTGSKVAAIKSLSPDVAVIHAQRADRQGNVHMWGPLGVSLEAAGAAKRVIVTCEELVDENVIKSDPNRTLIPGLMVSAVAVCPWGAHPSGLVGYYGHDDDFFIQYAQSTKQESLAAIWLNKYVRSIRDHQAYLKILGQDRLDRLRIKRSAKAAEVDYGY